MSGRVLLIVSGGIAAYKAPQLIRSLIAAQMQVRVVATRAALAFTTELALSTVSGGPVRTELLEPAQEHAVGHIELADWPDLVLVAPATADLMARAAHGRADDLAATVLLATRASVLWAPAMNTNMWRHPATRANVELLRRRGATFVGPDDGELACGWVGPGRMQDPQKIADAVADAVRARGQWSGLHVVVSAGPTRTYLDPVRFVSNASTGTMGFALAEIAAQRGATVTLVSGPVEKATPAGVDRVDVQTAEEMHAALDHVLGRQDVALLAMVAAVADLAIEPASGKLPKSELGQRLARAQPGVDVLATLASRYANRTYMLGFAAQTVPEDAPVADTLLASGRAKQARKGCHALFVNRVGVADRGFGSATNTGLLLRQAGEPEVLDAGAPRPKRELAGWLLDHVHPKARA